MATDNEKHWAGCHGETITYRELDKFLDYSILLNQADAEAGAERFATCIWGHSGIGKTSKVRQFKKKKVKWRGKDYDGYAIHYVSLAQFEEMGDLHGLPDKHVLVTKFDVMDSGELLEKWVPLDLSEGYLSQGWEVSHEAGIRTMYAPPEWVPTEDGPSILIIDDFNKAGSRIVKGAMQLLQDYGLMSWKLPDGCNIIMTGNPDEQDYFVTTLDPSQLQRLRSCTLKFDAKEWAVWAESAGMAPQVTSFVLAYPEQLTQGTQRTSPRSISEFGRFLSLGLNPSIRDIQVMAHALLDKATVASFISFMERDFELVVSPEDIMDGNPIVEKHIKDVMTRKEKRIDVVSVTCDRLFAYLSRPETEPTDDAVKNVQKFLCCEHLTAEIRYVFIDRLNKASDQNPNMDKWFMGDTTLMKLVMETV